MTTKLNQIIAVEKGVKSKSYAELTQAHHDVQKQALDETADLFADVPEAILRPEFKAQLDELVPLALTVSSEKARSELPKKVS